MQATTNQKAYELQSVYIENLGNGQFKMNPLPIEAQFAPIYSVLIQDFNQDGAADVLLGGNLHGAIPKIGRYDASYGTHLQGDGKGNFKTIPSNQSGFVVKGEIRAIKKVGNTIVVARNNDGLVTFRQD